MHMFLPHPECFNFMRTAIRTPIAGSPETNMSLATEQWANVQRVLQSIIALACPLMICIHGIMFSAELS